MGNTYLDALTGERTELRGKVSGVRDKLVAEKRPMNDTEKAETEQWRSRLAELDTEIEAVATEEIRAAKVDALASQIVTGAAEKPEPPTDEHTRSQGEGGGGAERLTGTAQVRDRDPGHYRSEADGGQHSWFGDQYRAQVLRDDSAKTRLVEHERALTATGEGPGLVGPKWLTERYEGILRQGRALANAVTNVPLGNDPRPMTLPKQTVGTSTVVADQAAENDAVGSTDQFDTSVDTITPGTIAGSQIFSRQFLDMATPAIDMLIYGDLVANYNLQIEKKVGTAMITAAGSAVATFANEAAFTGTAPAVPAVDAVIDAAVAVRAGRYAPADLIAMGVSRFGKFKKLKDTAGRPLVPMNRGVQNIYGVGDAVAVEGDIEGLGVIATEGISTGSYPESIVVARASDTLLFEGNLMRFRYEEVSGPQSIKVGIWNYYAVSVRRPGVGQKRIVVTAA
jgi:HK97 family phage major capsid protein